MQAVGQAIPIHSDKDKVEELKLLVATGLYRPDARVIAEAMLDNPEIAAQLRPARLTTARLFRRPSVLPVS